MSTTLAVKNEDDIDLLRYGRFLASYWVVIAACGVIAAIIGAVIAWRGPVLYQATVTMSVTQPSANQLTALTPATSRVIIGNLSLAEQTLKEAGINGITPQAFVDDALTIQPIPTTALIRVSVSLPDPTKARMAADILARKAVELSKRLDTSGATAMRDALKAQSDEAARRFAEAQSRLSAFEAANQMERREAEANALSKGGGELDAAITLEAEKSRLAVLEREAATYQSNRGGSAAGVVVADGDGQERRSGVVLPVAEALRFEAAQSRARVAQLERRQQAVAPGGQVGKRLNEMYGLRAEYARLQAERNAMKTVFTDASARYAEAVGRIVGTPPQLLVADSAVQPDRPLSRHTAKSALFGSIIGLAAGVIVAIVLNRRRVVRGAF